MNEDLRKWFGKGPTGTSSGGGWDRYGSDGQKLGKCGDGKKGGEAKACLSKEKAQVRTERKKIICKKKKSRPKEKWRCLKKVETELKENHQLIVRQGNNNEFKKIYKSIYYGSNVI